MSRYIDMTGETFSRLTVLGYAGRDRHGYALWLCRCECGKVFTVCSIHLRSGRTKSCGCLNREQLPIANTIHGMTGTTIFNKWKYMRRRCSSPSAHNYKWYGGRGIRVCDEWEHSFQAFYDWAMANGYDDSLSIERIDVNGNYEPSNCTWIPMRDQAKNKQNSKKYKEGYKYDVGEKA